MSVRDGRKGNEESAEISGRGGTCVVSKGVSKKDWCRLPGVIWELWEDLPHSFLFFIELFFQEGCPSGQPGKKKMVGMVKLLLVPGTQEQIGRHYASKCKEDEFEGINFPNFGFMEEISDVS